MGMLRLLSRIFKLSRGGGSMSPLSRLGSSAILVWVGIHSIGLAQNANTGAIAGVVTDPQGATVPGASVTIASRKTGEQRSARTNASGGFAVPLLDIGVYNVRFSAPGFADLDEQNIEVRITETTTVNASLRLGTASEIVNVNAEAQPLQRSSSTLGGTIDSTMITQLPLASRNYTQLMVLSAGVATSVPNAGTMGLNSIELASQGARPSDNSVEINGVDAMNVFTNTMGSYVGTQGIAVPSPDALDEFKVQTALYSAVTGRNAGANIAVITKSGGNRFHGSVFEYFRNDALNANDFFFNREGLPKPVMKQNQYGTTLCGPIQRDKFFFFLSYQGTRQINGVSSENESSSFTPGLTNDRSAAALGQEFAGQKSFSGLVPGGLGVAIAPDGSNINPVALSLLSIKLPNGQYLIPTPQEANGLSVFSEPGRFNEDQAVVNLDRQFGSSNRLSFKYFYSNQLSYLPLYQDNKPNTVPGYPATIPGLNHNLAVAYTRILSPNLVNVAQFGFTRFVGQVTGDEPITASSVGISVPSPIILPRITVLGGFSIGASHNLQQGVQTNMLSWGDTLSWTKGRHSLQFGIEVKRYNSTSYDDLDRHADLVFTDFPSFLLGLNAAQNGTPYSDVAASVTFAGSFARDLVATDVGSFIQDDFKVNSKLTLNLGLRHDYFGALSDALGRNSNFDFALALPVPPSGGTNSGYVVGKDTPGTIPSDVVRAGNNSLRDSNPWNFQPRIGFAYQPFDHLRNLIVRGGYGIYFSRTAGIGIFQNVVNPPFASYGQLVLAPGSTATFANPLPPVLPSSAFPLFTPRTVDSGQTFTTQDPRMKDPYTQQYSFNVQYEFARDYLLEVGYVGTKGTHLIGQVGVNQPLLASASAAVHGLTDNTTANASLRVPYQGLSSSVEEFKSVFDSSYNALEVSLTKRLSRNIDLHASYTRSKTLTDVQDALSGVYLATGSVSGDQSNFEQARGPAAFDRPNRFVAGYVWRLPRLRGSDRIVRAIVNNWETSGLLTLQSGLPLTIYDSSAGSIFSPLSTSRAQFVPGTTAADVATSGSVETRLNAFVNPNAFTAAPMIGNGTAFGNSGIGIIRGPGQRNLDIALVRRFAVPALGEQSSIQLRAEAFNVTNTANFGNPSTDRATPTSFGIITSTTVNPRIVAFALRLSF
jgi:hypothetical protein